MNYVGLALRGLFYGYPTCCIRFFVTEWFALRDAGEDFPNLCKGTGFIPCPVCNATYTDDEMIGKINEARAKTLAPFPAPGTDEEATLYGQWLLAEGHKYVRWE